MARRKYRAFKITGWIILGFISLILIITLVFYLGRGWILNRAVTYINEQQPGEVRVDQMNLIPFMHFPNVSLQLRNVSYYEKPQHPDSLLQEPILFLNEIYVTLDVMDLIRGDLQVSQARMEQGFLRLEIYEDSVSNLEYALGLRFKKDQEEDKVPVLPAVRIDLDRVSLTDILILMRDRTRDDHAQLKVNRLESSFSYLPDHVETDVKLDIDLNQLKYLTYSLESERNIYFDAEVALDPELKKVMVQPSSVRISGLEMEMWGTYEYMEVPRMDLAFRASNKGLDVLNEVFSGILDLDEIEQIGSGSIYLSGTVNGSVGENLPVIRINGVADQIGFRIKSIQKDVTDISFQAYGTNGGKLDLSEGVFQVEGFTATFPEGQINASISAVNMLEPEVHIELSGDVDLAGLEKIFKSELISELDGHIVLDGNMNGVVNRKRGEFLNESGILRARMTDVGFVLNQDSVKRDTLGSINGEVYLRDSIIGTEDLGFRINGNQVETEARIENLLLYFMGIDRDVKAEISVNTDLLRPATLFRDTSVAGLLGEELEGLHFNAGAVIAREELDKFLKHDSLPELRLTLDSFGVRLPVYAELRDLSAALTLGPDTVRLHRLQGNIGESRFDLSGLLANHNSLSGQDSAGIVTMSFDLSSDLLRAEDLLWYKQKFILPEAYRTEWLEEFSLKGSVEVPVAGLQSDSVSLDFNLDIGNLDWKFRYYPHRFEDVVAKIRRKGDLLHIAYFQGRAGESNLRMTASLDHFTDTLIENLEGSLVLESDLLDFNELLNYRLPEELKGAAGKDTSETSEPARLDQIDYPQLDLSLNIGELRYGDYTAYGLNGRLRSSPDKLFYLDSLITSMESGGSIMFNGQFNVSNPRFYTFIAEFDLENVYVSDLDFEMKSGEETYTLRENFRGKVTANGMAEIFFTPDFKIDIPGTTAMFKVKITDGELINFTPLQAAGKYLDNRDLNHVKFATLYNDFTLMDSRIIVPLMNVESTIGQLLIEGEQSLDGSYLYLLRLPTWLVRGAARSRLTDVKDAAQEDQIYQIIPGNFMRMTVWGQGEESDVKLGDKRENYR